MAMPPNMFTHPEDFEPPEVEFAEDAEAEEASHHHVHGEGCGHEAVEHGDHIDYLDGEHRHWWNRDHWDMH